MMTPTDILGNIKLYNADCMEVMKTFEDKQFDLAIVDPPYGIGAYWMKQKHTQHYGNKSWNDLPPDGDYFLELFRVSKNQIIWGGNYFLENLPITNSWIYWNKGGDVKKTNTSEGEMAWTSFKIPMRSVFIEWSGARKGKETGMKNIHPCQRPVDLHKWLLQNYAKEGDTILDTHFGSLSIGIACHDLKFDLTAIELDKDYYEMAKKRLINHQKQLTLF